MVLIIFSLGIGVIVTKGNLLQSGVYGHPHYGGREDDEWMDS